MSGRVKIKSKVVKSTLQNKDVIDMFHGVIGTDGASLNITHPKYLEIEKHVDRFIRILEALYASPILNYFTEAAANLDYYLFTLRKQMTENFNAPDLDSYFKDESIQENTLEALMASVKDYSTIPIDITARFSETYTNVKKCNIVNAIVVTCKNLVSYKKSLEDPNDLKDKFLLKGGLNFAPLPNLIFNFKHIYIDDRLTQDNKEFICIYITNYE